MVYHLRTVSDNSGAHTVIVAAVPDTKTPKKKYSKHKHGNKADDTTQPALEQHPN